MSHCKKNVSRYATFLQVYVIEGRLKALLTEKGWNQRKLALISGVSPSQIARYLKGMAVTDENAKKIALAFDIPLDVLVFGVRAETSVPDDDTYFAAPVVGRAAAGLPIAQEWRESDVVKVHRAVKASAGPGEYAACWVVGDSMVPRLRSGSLVLFKREPIKPMDAKRGTIYAINLPEDDGATLKLVRWREKTREVDLVSANPEYDIQTYSAKDVTILGPVVGIVWEAV